jgi:hypothetical protein
MQSTLSRTEHTFKENFGMCACLVSKKKTEQSQHQGIMVHVSCLKSQLKANKGAKG